MLTLAGTWATAQPGRRPLVRPDAARDYVGPTSALLVAPADSALAFTQVQSPPGRPAFASVRRPYHTWRATLLVGVVVLRTGYRPARYYMMGAGLVIVSVGVYSLTQFGLLPSNMWTMARGWLGYSI